MSYGAVGVLQCPAYSLIGLWFGGRTGPGQEPRAARSLAGDLEALLTWPGALRIVERPRWQARRIVDECR
jgi:hypothetical protein